MRNLRANEGKCLIVGCVVVLVVVLLLVAASGFGVYRLNKFVEEYTDVTPLQLPTVEMAQEDVDALVARVDEYETTFKDGEADKPLELTQDDLNILIQHHEELEFFRDKLYITLDGDKVGGQVSWPLDEIPMMDGRYFNGTATFDVEFRDERLNVYLDSASIKGEPVPEEVMDQLSRENLAGDWQRGEDGRELLENLDTLEVKDGRLIITPKLSSPQPASPVKSDSQ